MVATNTTVSKRKKIFTIQVNQQAYRDKNKCKTLITLKETLGPQIAHCESENRNFIQFRDDFFRKRQQPREVIQLGVKSISMSFRRVPRPEIRFKKQDLAINISCLFSTILFHSISSTLPETTVKL